MMLCTANNPKFAVFSILQSISRNTANTNGESETYLYAHGEGK